MLKVDGTALMWYNLKPLVSRLFLFKTFSENSFWMFDTIIWSTENPISLLFDSLFSALNNSILPYFFSIAVILWWYIGLTSLPSIHHKPNTGKTVFSTRISDQIWFTNKIIVFYAWHKYSVATYSRSRAQHKVPWHQLGFKTVQNDQNMKKESKSTQLGLIHYGLHNLSSNLSTARFINRQWF